MKGRTGGLEMVMLLKARVIGGRVMNAGSGRKQEAVGSGQIYIHSVRQCDCKYDFIDEERPREVEILAQGHTAKQRQSKARKADFCILKSSHTHTHTHTSGEGSEQAPCSHHLLSTTANPRAGSISSVSFLLSHLRIISKQIPDIVSFHP